MPWRVPVLLNASMVNYPSRRKMKPQRSMIQWTERNWNKIFVNPPLESEISGAVHLVQPGLIAGRQADPGEF